MQSRKKIICTAGECQNDIIKTENSFSVCKYGCKFFFYQDGDYNEIIYLNKNVCKYILQQDEDISIFNVDDINKLLSYRDKYKCFYKSVNTFMDNLDDFIFNLRVIIREDDYNLQLFDSDLRQLISILDDFSNLRNSTTKIIKNAITFWRFTNDNNTENNAVFRPAPKCDFCSNRLNCKDDKTEKSFICPYGYTLYKYMNYNIYGVKVHGFFDRKKCIRNYKDRIVPVISKKLLDFYLLKHQKLEEDIIIVSRFIHDLGQYIPGIRNQLPFSVAPMNIVSDRDKKSIDAFIDAIQCLAKSMQNRIDNRVESGISCFAPYQLFDKYRICFESQSFTIRIFSSTDFRFLYKIYCLNGFETLVLNLLSNSCKYLPDDYSKNEISVDLQKTNEGIKIIVFSWGPIVRGDEINKIGTLYFRSVEAQKTGIDGSGIGLNQIVEYIKRAELKISFFSDNEKTLQKGTICYAPFIVTIDIPNTLCK